MKSRLLRASSGGGRLGNDPLRNRQTFGDEAENEAALLSVIDALCDPSDLSCLGFHGALPGMKLTKATLASEGQVFKSEQVVIRLWREARDHAESATSGASSSMNCWI